MWTLTKRKKNKQKAKKNTAKNSFVNASPHIAFIRKFRSIVRRITLLAVVSISVALFSGAVWLWQSGYIGKTIQHALDNIYTTTAQWTGFTIRNVYLEGQEYTSTNHILSALDVEIGAPLFTLSLDNMQQQLEALPWVKHAVIERQYPTTLHVRIIEHTPLALWQHNGALAVIDIEGQVIQETNIHSFSDYVVLIGEDAPNYAHSFFDIANLYPELLEHISSATRIGERRWNIRFQNGLEVKLPEANPEEAWQQLSDFHKEQDILSGKFNHIDLRVSNKIYVGTSS